MASAVIAGRRQGNGGQSAWMRRFWLVMVVAMVASALVLWHYAKGSAEEDEDVYVPVKVKTRVAGSRFVLCKLNLLIDPEQEKGIAKRLDQIQVAMGEALSDAYTTPGRPALKTVREQLFTAINRQLPRKLKVRDVLIEELLVGIS